MTSDSSRLLAAAGALVEQGHEMIGQSLAFRHPGTKLLYVSGGPEGVIEPDRPYLAKPFTVADLLWKVRGVLDQRIG